MRARCVQTGWLHTSQHFHDVGMHICAGMRRGAGGFLAACRPGRTKVAGMRACCLDVRVAGDEAMVDLAA